MSQLQFQSSLSPRVLPYVATNVEVSGLGVRESVPLRKRPPTRSIQRCPGQITRAHLGAEALEADSVPLRVADFARSNRLWGWLVLIRGMLSHRLVADYAIELVQDPEVDDMPIICFVVHSHAGVAELLDFDGQLTRRMCDEIPADDRVNFAIRFDLD
jgi:hypothetical protein